MNEDCSLNPICLLSRSDTQTFSLYHSFYLIKLINEEYSSPLSPPPPPPSSSSNSNSNSLPSLNTNENYGKKIDCNIIFHIPLKRDRLEDIKTAVKYFSVNINLLDSNDTYGNFVITTSDGSRFYALWKSSASFLFVAVFNHYLFTY